MNTSHNKLLLRKQSIRTLTATELSVAHGGARTGSPTTTTTNTGSTCHGCAPTTGQATARTKL
jgi:hypothetical protein